MSAHEDDLIDLLHVSKQIRQSVQPVEPSPGFKRHLRADLAVAMGVPRPTHIIITQPSHASSPTLLLGALFGLVALALAILLLRARGTDQEA